MTGGTVLGRASSGNQETGSSPGAASDLLCDLRPGGQAFCSSVFLGISVGMGQMVAEVSPSSDTLGGLVLIGQ